VGYARFALHDVEYRRGNVRVTATRVEADTPALWLWRRSTGNSREIIAGRWTVDVQPADAMAAGASQGNRSPASAVSAGSRATPSAPASASSGWMPLRAILRKVGAGLDRWLPQAKAG